MAVAPVGKNPLSPRLWMIPDRFSPSRVRFAASRPGLLRADLKGGAIYEGKGGWGRVLPGPEGNLVFSQGVGAALGS